MTLSGGLQQTTDQNVGPAVSDAKMPIPEFVYRYLRSAILEGRLPPGVSLRQDDIANRLRVSRVPVREAMSRLESDGLIVLRPRRGWAVTELGWDELVEIFELRMVVEEHAAHVAARARTAEDIEAVEDLMVRMEQVPSGRLDEWADLNRAFHARIVQAGRRRRLCAVSETLRDSLEAYLRIEMRLPGTLPNSLEEHRLMFQAFKAGDADGLGRLSRQHIEAAARRLRESRLQSSTLSVQRSQGPSAVGAGLS